MTVHLPQHVVVGTEEHLLLPANPLRVSAVVTNWSLWPLIVYSQKGEPHAEGSRIAVLGHGMPAELLSFNFVYCGDVFATLIGGTGQVRVVELDAA